MSHEIPQSAADGALPDALRWQLRALRQDVEPANDLWGGIASRLAEPPRAAPPGRRGWSQLAVAATLVVAVGSIALLATRGAPAHQDTTALHEARALEAEYREVFASLGAAPATGPIAPAVAELDQSAELIRRALDRDPDSRLLLDQLRRTYALRLALSQRALAG